MPRGYVSSHLDWSCVDTWAVNVVVREGRYMNLSSEEKIVATQRMLARGVRPDEIASRLRMNDRLVHRYKNYQVPEHLLRYNYDNGHTLSEGVASMTG